MELPFTWKSISEILAAGKWIEFPFNGKNIPLTKLKKTRWKYVDRTSYMVEWLNSYMEEPANAPNFRAGLKQLGIGVSVAVPGREEPKGIRLLTLKQFKPVTFGLLRQGSPTPEITAFIEAVKARVELIKKE